jgi:hypothetical protein
MPNEVEFEVGGRYRNRLDWYEVLGINGDQLKVRYENECEVDRRTHRTQRCQ